MKYSNQTSSKQKSKLRACHTRATSDKNTVKITRQELVSRFRSSSAYTAVLFFAATDCHLNG